ncbi:PREDICTED: uncharacterized protein C22orf31 homolog isoform X1 [Poecilia mexicana]|uniref:uncharacterized protein LOC103145581 isoform X1 n=2 Tax=Poecilia formosa TaxID=48698 RepID=UPI000443DC28|nr:PREDICTED: uncharacterized protein C22orf31 homolog isoform X1 [Poecilia formosa]XP_014859091.1 PREDICTED: uncharacterized protein C22orf31 homolog isoform X1 [Poecilia mexicana]
MANHLISRSLLQVNEMLPYELRQSIRCPKKYGQTVKERSFLLAPPFGSELMFEEHDAEKPLDERYIRNAAVIPDLSDQLCSAKAVEMEETSGAALTIHGYSVEDFQKTYHSVVDPLLYRPCGKLKPYSLELGFTIKEHLLDGLAYPTLEISERPDGKMEVTERFCVLRSPPYIDVDCKGDPW